MQFVQLTDGMIINLAHVRSIEIAISAPQEDFENNFAVLYWAAFSGLALTLTKVDFDLIKHACEKIGLL